MTKYRSHFTKREYEQLFTRAVPAPTLDGCRVKVVSEWGRQTMIACIDRLSKEPRQ